MDEKSRQEKQRQWLARRARPHTKKVVTYKVFPNKNQGLVDGPMTITPGQCPCSICGHEFMWECDEAQCDCCSSACT